MSKFYLYGDGPDTTITDLNRIAGVIELLPTPDGKVCEELLKTGRFNITPYGNVEQDENGIITGFNLIGFSVTPKIK